MILRTVMCLMILFCSGCAHTRLAPRAVPTPVEKLVDLAPRSAGFHISCDVNEIVGHQYLLVLLPFGRISIEDPARHISHHVKTALAEKGIASYETSIEDASVTIRCIDFSLSAFDYLFFRQIVGILSWSIEGRPGTTYDRLPVQRTRTSALKAFAFHAQLDYQLHRLLTDAADTMSRSPVWGVAVRRR